LRFDSLLGTSGQNLDDIDLQSTIDSRVQILENCLKWGVIAPTCPDTLSMRRRKKLFYIENFVF